MSTAGVGATLAADQAHRSMETPSQTLYVNNINEKIKKDVLKKTLYMLFRQHGRILEIVASKGLKKRGQAWIVFEDIAAASNAMKSKQGFNFYDKPLVSPICLI